MELLILALISKTPSFESNKSFSKILLQSREILETELFKIQFKSPIVISSLPVQPKTRLKV